MPLTLPSSVQEYLAQYRHKIELHTHTYPVSGCSKYSPDALIRDLAAKGYSTVVITNHISPGSAFHAAEDPVQAFLSDYRTARETGEKLGVHVLLGAEYHLQETANDYLVFGVDEEFLREAIHCLDMPYADFYAKFRSPERLIVQAHPFRRGMMRTPASLLDGAEVFNMHPNHHGQNPAAVRWADEENIPVMTMGSDVHFPGGEGMCALRAKSAPANNEELLTLLRSGDYLMEIAGCPLIPQTFYK